MKLAHWADLCPKGRGKGAAVPQLGALVEKYQMVLGQFLFGTMFAKENTGNETYPIRGQIVFIIFRDICMLRISWSWFSHSAWYASQPSTLIFAWHAHFGWFRTPAPHFRCFWLLSLVKPQLRKGHVDSSTECRRSEQQHPVGTGVEFFLTRETMWFWEQNCLKHGQTNLKNNFSRSVSFDSLRLEVDVTSEC